MVPILACLVGVDQFLKQWFRDHSAVLVCNNGMAFGMPVPRLFLLGMAGVFCLVFAAELYRGREGLADPRSMGLLLLLSGALSNLWDRVWHGCVTDYIQPASFFPAFNLGDVWIFSGGILLAASLWFRREKSL
jgi:signal peptidase II